MIKSNKTYLDVTILPCVVGEVEDRNAVSARVRPQAAEERDFLSRDHRTLVVGDAANVATAGLHLLPADGLLHAAVQLLERSQVHTPHSWHGSLLQVSAAVDVHASISLKTKGFYLLLGAAVTPDEGAVVGSALRQLALHTDLVPDLLRLLLLQTRRAH